MPALFADALRHVPARREDGAVNVFVETPTGSRDKFDLDHETGLFEWSVRPFPFPSASCRARSPRTAIRST